jgi:hypothetical protein
MLIEAALLSRNMSSFVTVIPFYYGSDSAKTKSFGSYGYGSYGSGSATLPKSD